MAFDIHPCAWRCFVCVSEKSLFDSFPVLKMPICTKAQGQSANPALWFTPLLFAELTATPIPPRYPHTCTRRHLISHPKLKHLSTEVTFPLNETHNLILLPPLSHLFCLSQCKLDYQSCITGKGIAVKCPGMCPCPSQQEQSSVDKKGSCARKSVCYRESRILCRRNSKFFLI